MIVNMGGGALAGFAKRTREHKSVFSIYHTPRGMSKTFFLSLDSPSFSTLLPQKRKLERLSGNLPLIE
jgi:ABC-type antimicrobial peptide transport system ATPase subunit